MTNDKQKKDFLKELADLMRKHKVQDFEVITDFRAYDMVIEGIDINFEDGEYVSIGHEYLDRPRLIAAKEKI